MKYEIGDKVKCIDFGKRDSSDGDGKGDGGAGWELGKEFYIDRVNRHPNHKHGDVVWSNDFNFGVFEYAIELLNEVQQQYEIY